MRTWFYFDDSRVGPLSESVLHDMISSGVIHAGTLVWTDGFAEWKPLGSVDGFTPAAAPAGFESPRSGARLELPGVGWSRVARYLGISSVLVLPAPLAIVAGIVALRDQRRSPYRGREARWAIFAVMMGSVFTVILIWLVVAAALG